MKKVIARVEGALTLDDLRRLFRETGEWSGQCRVECRGCVESSIGSITVVETDAERVDADTDVEDGEK